MADEGRQNRVAERIQTTVARMLANNKIKDPRLGFVTITDVRVTGDLQHATIFYTVYGSEKDRRGTAQAFRSAKGLIRSAVGKALGIRLTPTLDFQLDSLPETSAAFESALKEAKASDEELAKLAEHAEYAGEADPYKKPREEDFDEDEDWVDEIIGKDEPASDQN